ncbi:aromatic-ring-hydroxylating dioxygenase subunit beta [Rhodococcus sp. MSC1_016]|jgi:p-cumate 2,3-dioxygenase beta subunit|uniref:aromatic-ring-hydroxylating dioxygenase subunit beta n=1 Tax=Rhodococcus sp. MSC1_016 TaxID=2909266 RepID=UPI00202FB75B|nr:aromatic-ring-hydroxylating dioxygenase subunit beta [Rhodococcus sp. MSC1_016]
MSMTTSTVDLALIAEIEQFLYSDADLLDEWRLHEWLDLFLPEGQYLVPSTVNRDGDPNTDLFLVQDDRFLLEQRVNSLQTRAAHAEYPHSRTRRLITNVRAFSSGDTVDVIANFAIYRFRSGVSDVYVGRYQHQLVRTESGELKFRVRKSVLDLEALRPHGKVSFIL